jgi:hypothetical protein
MVCFAFIDPVLIGHDDYPPPAFATLATRKDGQATMATSWRSRGQRTVPTYSSPRSGIAGYFGPPDILST